MLIQLRDPADVPLNERHSSRGQGMMLTGIDPRHSKFEFERERAGRERAEAP